MRRISVLAAILVLAGAFASSPLDAARATDADSCAITGKKPAVQTQSTDTTCKHHTNLPDRFAKVSG